MPPFSPARALSVLDALIARQLEAILGHPELKAMREAWLALAFVVDRVDTGEPIQIAFMDVGMGELREDLADANSVLVRELDTLVAGPEASADEAPFSLVVANHLFALDDAGDIALLDSIVTLGARTNKPWLLPATPGRVHATFVQLRQREESIYLALCVSRLRLDGDELVSGAHAIAVLVARSFAAYRWCPNITGDVDGRLDGIASVEPTLRRDERQSLAASGLVAFGDQPNAAMLLEAPTVREPRDFGPKEEQRTFDDALNTQLPYVLILSRLAHYAKVLWRQELLAGTPPECAEHELNAWLNRFCADARVGTTAYRQRHPLRKARIVVHEGVPRRFTLRVRPHFKYRSAFFALTTHGVLDRRRPSLATPDLQELDANVSGVAIPPLDGDLCYRDARTDHVLAEQSDHERDEPRALVLVDPRSGARRELLNGATLAACFHPDGRHILVATGDRDLVLYRLDDMAVIRRFPPQAATALAVDPSGAYVAAASNIVRVWSLANARPVSHVRVPADHLDAVRFAPDGALLVTGTRGGVTKRWRSA